MCSGDAHRASFSIPVRRFVLGLRRLGPGLRRLAAQLHRLCPELRRFAAYMSLQGLPGENNAGVAWLNRAYPHANAEP